MTTQPAHDAERRTLPQGDARLLAKPPLEVVICEIRLLSSADLTLGASEGSKLQSIASTAGFPVERLEPAQQQEIQVQFAPGQPALPHVQKHSSGWQLVGNEGTSIATILPNAVTLQTTSYTSWAGTFRPALAAVLAATGEVVEPIMRQRIGLRYVDRLVDPAADTASAWRGRVSDSLIGPVIDPKLGQHVVTAQQQVDLNLGGTRGAVLRHGPFSDGALRGAISYLVDVDVFDNSTVEFHVSKTLDVLDELNQAALSIFQAALLPEYLQDLREGR
jgi:uncharacterized protein (TIGR04255 family)